MYNWKRILFDKCAFLFRGSTCLRSLLEARWNCSLNVGAIRTVLRKIPRKKRFKCIECSLNSSRGSPQESLAENFSRGILPWQAGGSVDWRWVACPSWPSRLHHPNTLSTAFLERFLASACYSQFPPLFLLRFRAILFRLPSFSPLPKVPRTSHVSSRSSFVSDASRGLWRDFLRLTSAGFFEVNLSYVRRENRKIVSYISTVL